MTGNYVADAVGFLVGLVIQLVPGWREKWEKWPYRLLVLFGVCFGVAFASMALVCYASAPLGFDCVPLTSWPGIWACINAGAAAIGFFGIGEMGRVTIGAVKSDVARLRAKLRARRQARRAKRRAKR